MRRKKLRLGWRASLLVALAAGVLSAGAASSGASGSGSGALGRDAGFPPFRSGVYGLYVNGYDCTWKLTVSGGSVSGTMTCSAGGVPEALTGTVVQGKRFEITRDCSVNFGGNKCIQVYTSTSYVNGKYVGTMEGTGGGGQFWLTPAKPPIDTKPPVVQAFSRSGVVRGKTVDLFYKWKDDGRVAYEITVLHGGKIIARRPHDEFTYYDSDTNTPLWETWKVPKAIKVPPPLSFCIRAWDQAGNKSKDCATITLRG